MSKTLSDKTINNFVPRTGIATGDFISSDDMNTCLETLGERTGYLYTLGISPHSAAYTYPPGAFCQVEGVVYRAVTANTGKPPASNPAIWMVCPMTLGEIENAIRLSTYAPLASPALTGTPTAPTAAAGTNNMQIATTAFVQNGLSGKLNKSGDVVSGLLTAQYINDWVGFVANNPTEGKSTYFDGQVAGIPRGGVQVMPAAAGAGEYFTSIRATPPGATNADRCVGGLDVYATGLFANAYGWLHDYFLKRSDCVVGSYPSHYGGAQTFKIRNLNLMITTMYVPGLGADTTLNLPEAYTGVVHAFATDAGSGKNDLGAIAVNGTKVRVYAVPVTNTNILLIGYKDNI